MAGPTNVLEGTTLHQLLSDDENRLLDAIDELRSQGVGKLLEGKGLPQLIVCGDQSSGKSSVLEALTRVRFPTRSSICTTFPTELRLRREPRTQVSCRIKAAASRSAEDKERLARFQQSFDSADKFPDLISAARECMNGAAKSSHNSTFFEDVLEVEIAGPKVVPLTIVDLPGLIHYRSGSGIGNQEVELVASLVKNYMKEDNSIILAVVSAHNDINNQIVLRHVKDIVPHGNRTLGIITKPDELPSGSEKEQEYLDYARTNPIKFQYGWHVVRNRSYEEQGNSFNERDEKEEQFFLSSNWSSLSPREVGRGINALRQKLSKMLLDHIGQSLPSIIDRLDSDLLDSENELNKLGAARSTLNDQREFLSNISDDFGEYTRDALDGRYHRRAFFGDPLSPEGIEKRLRAHVRNLNDQFASRMLQVGHRWHIVEDAELRSEVLKTQHIDHPNVIAKSAFLKNHVDALALSERGSELPGISNPLLIGSLFHQQSEPWEGIASAHLDTVWKAVKQFLETLLGHLADERTCDQLLIHIIDPAMEARRERLKDKLNELLIPHRHHEPINIDPQFARKVWSMREQRVAKNVVETVRKELQARDSKAAPPSVDEIMAKLSATNPLIDDKYGSHETYECMQAYYETTILIFINNVASLAVEYCLLTGLPKIFSSATLRDQPEEKLELIAMESKDTISERERLNERKKILQKGLRIIKRIQPGARTARSTPKANQDAQTRPEWNARFRPNWFPPTIDQATGSTAKESGRSNSSSYSLPILNVQPQKDASTPISSAGIRANSASPGHRASPNPSGSSPSPFARPAASDRASPETIVSSTERPSLGLFDSVRPKSSSGSGPFQAATTAPSSSTSTPSFGASGSSGASGSGLFGKPAQSPASTSSAFGNTAKSTATGGGLFGTARPSTQSGTPFGSSLFGSAIGSTPTTGTGFGQTATPNLFGGGVAFGQGSTSGSTPTTAGGFGSSSQTATSNGFGGFGSAKSAAPNGKGESSSPLLHMEKDGRCVNTFQALEYYFQNTTSFEELRLQDYEEGHRPLPIASK